MISSDKHQLFVRTAPMRYLYEHNGIARCTNSLNGGSFCFSPVQEVAEQECVANQSAAKSLP